MQMNSILTLYKLEPDIHYVGSVYTTKNDASNNKFRKLPNTVVVETNKHNFIKNGNLIKDKDLTYVDITNLSYLSSQNPDIRRYEKYIKMFREMGTDIVETFFGTMEVFPVRKIFEKEGKYLNENFFDKKCIYYFSTTKEGIETFFNKYLDTENATLTKDVQKFLDKFEDGMLFCATY